MQQKWNNGYSDVQIDSLSVELIGLKKSFDTIIASIEKRYDCKVMVSNVNAPSGSTAFDVSDLTDFVVLPNKGSGKTFKNCCI